MLANAERSLPSFSFPRRSLEATAAPDYLSKHDSFRL